MSAIASSIAPDSFLYAKLVVGGPIKSETACVYSCPTTPVLTIPSQNLSEYLPPNAFGHVPHVLVAIKYEYTTVEVAGYRSLPTRPIPPKLLPPFMPNTSL